MIVREQDCLKHYGVLGMKWGVHRAKVNATKAKNLRDKQSLKEWDEIANYKKSKGNMRGYQKAKQAKRSQLEKAQKFENKAKAIRKKHETRSGKKTVSKVEKMSTGKALAQSMVFGTYGALKYNQARAKGYNRGKAAAGGLLGKIGNNFTGGILSIVEPRLREK